jgi:RimJ/RimL family protein N-acetyltransferase
MVNPRTRLGELGYGIAWEHSGKGLATEAAHAVVYWAFKQFQLNKMRPRTHGM